MNDPDAVDALDGIVRVLHDVANRPANVVLLDLAVEAGGGEAGDDLRAGLQANALGSTWLEGLQPVIQKRRELN